MRLHDFIGLLAGDLEPYVKRQGGEFHVARAPTDPYYLLATGNFKSFGVILSFLGGEPLNTDVHPHGLEDARVEVIVGHGMDLRTQPGAWLYLDDPASAPLLKNFSIIRALALTIVFRGAPGCDDAYALNQGVEQVTLPDHTPLKAFKQTIAWPIKIDLDEAPYRYLDLPHAGLSQPKGATP